MTNKIPIHDLNLSFHINIEAISYANDYDFNKLHKHNYFEILFFKKGGGYQLIDFKKYPIKDNSCYLIKPNQIHLLERTADSDGLLIQFTENMVLSSTNNLVFSMLKSYVDNAILFENDVTLSTHFIKTLELIAGIKKEKSLFYQEKLLHYLSILLLSIYEKTAAIQNKSIQIDGALIQFIDLVDQKLNSISVTEYANALNVSTKKLTTLVKEHFDITPLKYIHRILLLRIKRDLAFKGSSLKEIAYSFNFDSPQNFSLFIKKETGLSPSELQKKIIA